MSEIDDLDRTIYGGTDKIGAAKDGRVAHNRIRKMERAEATRLRKKFYAGSNVTPSLPRLKFLERD